jgi:hypothetical protein
MAFLASLNSKFNEIKEHDILGIIVCNGISMDALPGCEVLEVHYALSEELLDENGFFYAKAKTPPRKGEVVLRYAFRFKEGKVVDVQRTREFVQINKLCNSEDKLIYN